MTVRVERTTDIAADPERVWAFIADPEKRSGAISAVSDYTLEDPDTNRVVWHLDLPIPLLGSIADVVTKDVERDPPHHVKFVGRSSVMRVTGEHDLEPVDGGTRLTNRFVVDGRLPGVESFFRRNLDHELDNIEAALRADLGIEA